MPTLIPDNRGIGSSVAAATAAAAAAASSSSWRVRDAADSLLARRGLRSTNVFDGKIDLPPNGNNGDDEINLSKWFDVYTCQARLRRDKTPIVKMALDAAATAIMESLWQDDDDDNNNNNNNAKQETDSRSSKKKRLPPLLDEIERLQAIRMESMERAIVNKDMGKRRIAVQKEQEKLRQQCKAPLSETKMPDKTDASNSGGEVPKGKVKAEEETFATATTEKGSGTRVKSKEANNNNNPNNKKPAAAVAPVPSSPPKFTRNTPASSASALETRLTGSRALLCMAGNVAFDSLTPALPEWDSIDVADVPQNPAFHIHRHDPTSTSINSISCSSPTIAAATTTAAKEGAEENSPSADVKPNTPTVPNMGPVIVEAQKLGKHIENVANNAVKRSRRRFRFRKDNIRFRNNCSSSTHDENDDLLLRKRDSGFRILENPFAWKDGENETDNEGGGTSPMDVDENASIVTNTSPEVENETWGKVCIPRLMSILQTGTGNAILHDVMWSTRHRRIANLLQEISMITNTGTKGGEFEDAPTDRNFGPHLIITVQPDVDLFAKEFKHVNSHLRFMSTVDETSLRALPYKGTKEEKRKLRKQFPLATGLQDASFHVILTSYTDFLTDYLHFCQTPFEVVILDDGVSFMAAAINDINSTIANVWEDALFSKNDQQMGLAGTTLKDWDYSADDIDEEAVKEAWIGLTARHRLVTSSRLKVGHPRSPADLLPVSGLLNCVLPHFAHAVKEEWDRSRIASDATSMSHFRKLLTRCLVVYNPSSSNVGATIEDGIKAEENVEIEEGETVEENIKRKEDAQPPPSSSIYEETMKALKGELPDSVLPKDFPAVPEEIPEDRFIAEGKVASYRRRSSLQWLGPIESSWLRYELGTVSFKPLLKAMKNSLNYGHICEEVTTTLALTTGFTGQIMGTLAWKLALRSGKSFGSEQGLRQHLSTHHALPGTWLCRTCGVDCVTSYARTHHERSCGQPSGGSGSANQDSGNSAPGAKKNTGKKKGKPSKSSGDPPVEKEEKDADGSVRVPSYRGVWVDQAGKYFIKIKSERVCGDDKKKPLIFESIEEAAKKYDTLLKSKDEENETRIEYNFKPNGTRIIYEDVTTSSATGLGGGVVPALSVINIKDLPPDVKPLLRDPRQTSRTGGNSKRHVYAYRGVCRQARKAHDRWQSQISFLGVNHYLGTFDSEWDAAAIYAWAHLILYGEEATRQAQKEGEEAAAAYEQEKKDIAAGKIPAAPPKPEKKPKAAPKASEKEKKGFKKEDSQLKIKRKPGRPPRKRPPEDPSTKPPQGKRAKMAAANNIDLTPILAQSAMKVTILAPAQKFTEMSDEQLMQEAAIKLVAARTVNYCITEVALQAPVHVDFRPCIPWDEDAYDPLSGGALLVGLDPSLFGWTVDSIVSKQYFGSDTDKKNAITALTQEFGKDGLNQHFRSLVQGSTTVIGSASSRMKRVYSSLGMGSPPMGGPIGIIDCNTGGNSKCCSEAAACIRYVPTETGDFQLSALSTDLITMNGQRITPEMGSFPLFNEDICTIGSRVFLFLLPFV